MRIRLLVTVVCLFIMCAAAVQSTPIHEAAAKGNLAKVQSLVKKDHSLVNAKDKDGAAPLHHACVSNSSAIVKYLINEKADVNAKKNDGVTPLHVAASLGHKEIVEILLANKADINVTDKQERTPLFVAQENNRTAVVELLKAHGATASAQIQQPVNRPSQDNSVSQSPTSDEDPVTLTQNALNSLEIGDFKSIVNRFDATMKQSMDATSLAQTWRTLLSQAGNLTGRGAPSTIKVRGFDVVTIPCEFQKARLNFQLSFDSKRQISGIYFLNNRK